jgi:putative transposase
MAGSPGGWPSQEKLDIVKSAGSCPLTERRFDLRSSRMTNRKKPTHGVWINPDRPTIVFVTVCTQHRRTWLATSENHRLLRDVWNRSSAWLVGRYVLMPDHLHLFAAPGPLELPLDNWVRYWKSQFTRLRNDDSCIWQTDHWDTRLRSDESYEEKWWYVRNNPVRAGLVAESAEWPFQGELNTLEW